MDTYGLVPTWSLVKFWLRYTFRICFDRFNRPITFTCVNDLFTGSFPWKVMNRFDIIPWQFREIVYIRSFVLFRYLTVL